MDKIMRFRKFIANKKQVLLKQAIQGVMKNKYLIMHCIEVDILEM